MKIKDIIFDLHNRIESQTGRRINNAEMADKIGVSSATYKDYASGKTEPLAMKALLEILNMIDSDVEIAKIVRMWKSKKT